MPYFIEKLNPPNAFPRGTKGLGSPPLYPRSAGKVSPSSKACEGRFGRGKAAVTLKGRYLLVTDLFGEVLVWHTCIMHRLSYTSIRVTYSTFQGCETGSPNPPGEKTTVFP